MEKLFNPKVKVIKMEEGSRKLVDFNTGIIPAAIGGLVSASNLNEYVDGREIFESVNKFREVPLDSTALQELRKEAEEKQLTLVNEMLTGEEYEDRLTGAFFYTDLVSRKVEKNVREEVTNEFINELNKLKSDYTKVLRELTTNKATVSRAVKNEMDAKEELSKVKKRADKQHRIDEHRIAQLEKEIEMLKTQLNK